MISNLNFIVLHPKYKLMYFQSKKWPEEWIDAARLVLREQWTSHYKPSDSEEPGSQSSSSNSESVSFNTHLFWNIWLTCLFTRLHKRVSSPLSMTLAPMLPLTNLKSTSTLQQYLQRISTLLHGGMQLASQVHWLGWRSTFYQHLVCKSIAQ